MKKIKFLPAPHVEVRVSVTDEMVADLRECRRMAEETNYDNISELERVLGEPLRGYSLESIEEREKARL